MTPNRAITAPAARGGECYSVGTVAIRARQADVCVIAKTDPDTARHFLGVRSLFLAIIANGVSWKESIIAPAMRPALEASLRIHAQRFAGRPQPVHRSSDKW
jgi:hypothetical protein